MSGVRVFFHSHLLKILNKDEATALRKDFKSYKESDILPDSFGRDCLYNHPNGLPLVRSEKLAHIHLASSNTVWQNNILQFYRTSDIHLIYCQASMNLDCYLLMAILSPNAHEQARDNSIMHNLARMAEIFRERY